VASQLILRGFTPYFPAHDDHGVDILLKEGTRIQVKCSHLAKRHPYPQGAYYFKLQKGPIVTGHRNIRYRPVQLFSKECDIVILWGIEENRFWVVPATLLDNRPNIVVGPETMHKALDMENINMMAKDGFTQEQIAEKLGVQQMTISRRLRGQFVQAKRTNSSRARACEDAWHLIQETKKEH